MARAKNIEIDTRKLIISLTELQEWEENFDLSYQYVMSNFKYHRFLDVDSHKIAKMLTGMHDKFLIHCQDEKADDFKKLSDTFLASGGLEGTEVEWTDTHYSVLHLLLLLANSPTNSVYSKSAGTVAEDAEDTFDWASYLREGEDISSRYYDESPISSEGEDEDPSTPEVVVSPVRGVQPEISVLESKQTESTKVDEKDEVCNEAENWLRRNVMTQYWNGHVDSAVTTRGRSSSLSVDWETYLSRVSGLYVPSAKNVITEYQVVREILWMLCGVDALFVVHWSDDHFVPNQNIRVLHLTDAVLQAVLIKAAHYGSVVQKLSQFVMKTVTPASDDCTRSRTYVAFAVALSDCIRELSRYVVEIETTVCRQDTTFTLSSLIQILTPRFNELDILDGILTAGILSCVDVTSSSLRVCRLLDVLFQTLTDVDDLGLNSVNKVSFVLPIWLKTFHPYIDLIDVWISSGTLNDPCCEFVVQRNSSVKLTDEKFWNEAYVLERFDDNVKPIDVSCDLSGDSLEFLRPVLKQIIVAGKSIELVNSLQQSRTQFTPTSLPSLHDAYISSVYQHLNSSESEPNNVIDVMKGSELVTRDCSLANRVCSLLNQSSESDALLMENILSVMSTATSTKSTSDSSENRYHGGTSLQQLSSILGISLCRHIERICQSVSAQLLSILCDNCQMLQYFSAIRRFFLMEAGCVLFEFSTPIFDKVNSSEMWYDVSFLNSLLMDALHSDTQFNIIVDRLRVAVDTNKLKKNSSLLNKLDSLSFEIDLPWPINLLLNFQCMTLYNSVFSFLLQIKHVKYLLDRLKFEDLDKSCSSSFSDGSTCSVSDEEESCDKRVQSQSLVHRMQIFRMRLLHFVNGLHTHIMTRILHSVGLEFQEALAAARDLDEVVSAHSTYLSKIRERCLLHPKVAFIRETVSRTLVLALNTVEMWNGNGLTKISVASLDKLTYDFGQYIQFLSSTINKVTMRGFFPHLELLSFSLVTCSQINSTLVS